jgi:protein deglycase
MKNILLLLANGFEFYEASVFIDVLGWNMNNGDRSTKVISCGLRKELMSTFNQKIVADTVIDDVCVEDFDAIAIPGGFDEYGFYEDAFDERFLELIRVFDRQGKIIASICVGALPIGKSGVLKGRKGTTYNKKNGIRQAKLKEFGVNVINKPIVIDDNIITSWNPATAMDVAFLLLEKLTSKGKGNYIKDIMGFER